MNPAQVSRENRGSPQQQHRVNIRYRPGKRYQRDPEQADRRRRGKPSECLEPRRILELVERAARRNRRPMTGTAKTAAVAATAPGTAAT